MSVFVPAPGPAKETVAAHGCGSCTLCCKLMAVQDLPEPKPRDQWCPHCIQGKGCGIYESRPASCRVFDCVWLQKPRLPDSLRPDRCKVVLSTVEKDRTLVANVDPGFPDAWRRPEMARLLALNMRRGVKIMVRVADRTQYLTAADLP
jgi:hypothetical protein